MTNKIIYYAYLTLICFCFVFVIQSKQGIQRPEKWRQTTSYVPNAAVINEVVKALIISWSTASIVNHVVKTTRPFPHCFGDMLSLHKAMSGGTRFALYFGKQFFRTYCNNINNQIVLTYQRQCKRLSFVSIWFVHVRHPFCLLLIIYGVYLKIEQQVVEKFFGI